MTGRLRRAAGLLAVAGSLALPAATISAAAAREGGSAAPATPAVEFVTDVRAARDALPGDPGRARIALGQAQTLAFDPAILAPAVAALARGDLTTARAWLDGVAGVLSLPENAAPGSIADARSRLDAVYARPPLDPLDRTATSSAGGPLGWVFDRFADLLRGADRSLGTAGEMVVGALAAAAIAVLVARRLRAVSAGRLLRGAGADPGDASADPDLEWQAAEAAAARGDLREAMRRAFRSALLAIADAGRVPVDAAWTTRELLANASADADVLAALAPAAAAFDLAWYAGRPVGQADWEAQRQRCQTLRRLAGRSAGTPAGGRA